MTKNLFLLCAIALLLSVLHAAAEEKSASKIPAREIPLQDVWAYVMPGTRDIHRLEPDKFGDDTKLSSEEKARLLRDSMIMKIRESLHAKRSMNSCFVVAGAGEDALNEAYQVFAGKSQSEKSFRADDTLSVVFYSRPLGSAVALRSIQLSGNKLKIEYALVPHREAYVSEHFALIPIGKLSSGSYEIQIQQSQPEPGVNANRVNQEVIAKSICGSCKFSISGD